MQFLKRLTSGSIFENGASILLTRLSYSFSSLLITILIARQLGVNDLGQYSIAMGLCTIFQYISVLGFDNIVIREIAKDNKKSTWLMQSGIVLGIISCLICTLIMVIAGKLLNYSPAIMKSVYLSSMVLLPSFLNLLFETVFIGVKKARNAFYTAIARELSWLLLSVWWVCLSHDINAVILSFVVSRILGFILFSYFLKKEQMPWWKDFHSTSLRDLVKHLPAFVVINILSNILLEIDIIILSRMVPIADVGFYSICKKILRVSFILIFSMVSALFPIIVETMHNSKEKIYECFLRFSWRMFMAGSLISVSVFILAQIIITLFLGKKFLPSVDYIHVLIWKIIPLSLSFLWSRFLMAFNEQNKDIIALMIGLPVFLILGILFVSKWGTIGMAYADIIALSILALVHLYFVDRYVTQEGVKV